MCNIKLSHQSVQHVLDTLLTMFHLLPGSKYHRKALQYIPLVHAFACLQSTMFVFTAIIKFANVAAQH
jgi:hypothetical protein